MISERYRSEYTGEFVISDTTWRDGVKIQQREWIPNQIQNHWISGRAAVIGSNSDRSMFDHTRLQRHRGGLHGRKRLQTYGALDTWRDMRLDFYATTISEELDSLSKKVHYDITPFFTRRVMYHEMTAVYTTAPKVLANPGKFYLIPHSVPMSNLALPLYIAAFDGHQEIYMLGYNQELTHYERSWMQDIENVMRAYSGVQFTLVGAASNMPEDWKKLANVRCMTHRKFVTHCDI
jgi:hypothetical protein